MQKVWIVICGLYAVGEIIMLTLGLDQFSLMLLGFMAIFPTLLLGIQFVFRNYKNKLYIFLWITSIGLNSIFFLGGLL